MYLPNQLVEPAHRLACLDIIVMALLKKLDLMPQTGFHRIPRRKRYLAYWHMIERDSGSAQ